MCYCIYLRTSSDLCHLHHKLIGFYNRVEKCLQRSTDWAFKYSSLRFVFKSLNEKANSSSLQHVSGTRSRSSLVTILPEDSDAFSKLEGVDVNHTPLVPKNRNCGTSIPFPYTFITHGMASD
jgi:hypothetical protein